jgi:hypothetical protein
MMCGDVLIFTATLTVRWPTREEWRGFPDELAMIRRCGASGVLPREARPAAWLECGPNPALRGDLGNDTPY